MLLADDNGQIDGQMQAEGRRPLYLLLAATELRGMGKDTDSFSLAGPLSHSRTMPRALWKS